MEVAQTCSVKMQGVYITMQNLHPAKIVTLTPDDMSVAETIALKMIRIRIKPAWKNTHKEKMK